MVIPAFQPSLHGVPRLRLHTRLTWSETFQLPALGVSVAEARRRVRTRLREWGVPERVRDDAETIVSELFTNAVRHSASWTVGCELRLNSGRLRVEVTDQGHGPGQPHRREADAHEEGGRGLLLVGALADEWGVVAAPAWGGDDHGVIGRVVWAALRVG